MVTDRTVDVGAERLARWISGFEQRHGGYSVAATATRVRLSAADGATAELHVPFPPLPGSADPVPALINHAQARRTVGIILVRRGGYAVGIADGGRLVAAKVGRAYVQGTTKAGGWSQQRYARRRDNQTRQAYAEAADVVARILLPQRTALDALVGGGDAPGVLAVLADPRLAGLADRLMLPIRPTPDPRQAVLVDFAAQLSRVRIGLNDLA